MLTNEDSKPVARRLGEYLDCDPEVIRSILKEQLGRMGTVQKKLLGELLVDAGVITVEKLDQAVLQQRLDRLKGCELFSGLSLDEQVSLRQWVVEVSFEKDSEFITQDEQGDCFYVLIDGQALVYRRGDYDEDIYISYVNPGESIGEMGYFSDGRRLANVRATKDSHLLMMKYTDLEKIFEVSPTLTRNFLNQITARLRKTNLRFEKTVARGMQTEKHLDNIYELFDMSEALTLRMGIESQIERIVTTAGKIMNAERATLFLLDEFTGELWAMLAEGVDKKEIRISKDQGIAGWAVCNDELVTIQDAYTDERFDSSTDKKTGFKTRNIMCGALKNLAGEIVGALQVINKKGGDFKKDDEDFFQAFLYQTAIAVENLQFYKRLIADHEKMVMLFDVSTYVSRTLNLETLFVKIVRKITQILNVERSSLFLLDTKTDELWSKVAQKSEVTEIRFPASEGLAGHVAKTGEVLNIEDAYTDPRFLPVVDEETGFHTRTVLCAPIINRNGDVIGVTQAINKKEAVFDKEDEALLKTLSSHLAVALENAQLFERTVEMKNYLESVQESISNSIITLDNNYRVVTANKASLKLFQVENGELYNQDVKLIIGKINRHLLEDIEQVYKTHKPVIDYDVEVLLPTGMQHTLNVNIVPLIDASSEQKGLVLVFEDITREKRIKGTLVRYMAKDIVDKLLDDPDNMALGGSRGKATVMFSDIRGYTSITESLTAENTVAFLNAYFGLMVNVIFEQGGVLDKYIGDGIMSVFGIPYSKNDDAVRAVRTAIQMHKRLSEYNRVKALSGSMPIHIGIGICTGEVISGNIGSERRMDYTVIGDGVNVASRIEKLTKHYGVDILISESTHDDLNCEFTTRFVDLVQIRGKTRPVRIYEVLGEKEKKLTYYQELFCKGIVSYTEMDFDKAADLFLQGVDGDPLCSIFLERCRNLQENKPASWDGVWVSPY